MMMDKSVASVHIEARVWDQLYLLAELDNRHHVVAMNKNFRDLMKDHFLHVGMFDQCFQPFYLLRNHIIGWVYVWDKIKENGMWRGYINLSDQYNSKLVLYVSIKKKDDSTGYYIIGEDRTEQYDELAKQLEQLRDLTQLKEAFDEASIIAITDSNGVITYVNDMFCQISKYDRTELIGRTHRIINSKHHPKQFFTNMWTTIKQGNVWRGEVKNRAKDGSYYWMNTTIVPFVGENGKPYQYVSIRSDITDRVAAETELAKVMEHDFRRTVKGLQNCIFKTEKNDEGEIIFTLSEGRIAEELSMTTELVGGKTLKEVWQVQFDEVEQYYERAFHGISEQFELSYGQRFFYISLSPISKDGTVKEVVASMIDITERKHAEEMIHYMAHYDALTQLPNRTLFNEQLQKAIAAAEQNNHQIAVMFMDLNRFKIVNDSMGHSMGDELLQQVAQRLKTHLPEHGYVSRQGGDEFTLYLEDADRKQAAQLAKRIVEQLAAPFILQKSEVFISPSIGICMYPDDGGTIEELLKCADAAMYHVKDKRTQHYCFFTEELHQKITARLELERDLRQAIGRGELELWYQPKMNLDSNSFIGIEALLRWNHPQLGLVAPNHFIELAEETNLIVPIGEWVLYEACRQMKQWLSLGTNPISVAVNISFRQFSDHEFADLIAKVLKETGLPPQHLELEITESVAQDPEYAISALKKIKELGVAVSIDDFGTGYSSLSYLSQFPIDRLKIDQSFVRNLNASNQAIIRTIIDIANHMGITVIAEGVETKEQVLFLKQHHCQEAQGYYYSRPITRHEIPSFIARYS